MDRRQFLRGTPAVFGAPLTGKAGIKTRPTPNGPVLEKAPSFPQGHDSQTNPSPEDNWGDPALLGGLSEEVPVPIIGLGETGRLATSPEITRKSPNAPFWRIVEVGTGIVSPTEMGIPNGAAHGSEQAIVGEGAVRDALISQVDLFYHPLVIFVGNPQEPFVAQQLEWLREVLAQVNTRAVWIRPPSQPDLRESPVPGPLLEIAPPKDKEDGVAASKKLAQHPAYYYPTLLWGLLAPFGRPNLVCVDLVDTLAVLNGQRAVVAKALVKGPDRMTVGIRSLIQQIQAGWEELERLKGGQFWILAPPEMSITEWDSGVQLMEEELSGLQSEDFPLVPGMPFGDYVGAFKDKVALSLVATLDT